LSAGHLGIARNRVTPNDFGLPVKDWTALIDVPTVKVHALTGIAVSIKNYTNSTGSRMPSHFDGSSKLA